ncbi:hypothetical protein [Micrococcus sp. M4NT]|uniref:hypothetical protein n=1 Tax=Micrococcus sp. M4NT TaxID=2957501 RepID=UPI0029BFC78F|nr:hypothetical protein [Micrococcus sp. M4NT]
MPSSRSSESGTATPSTPASASAAPSDAQGTARAALDQLAVKGRAPKTGDSREEFGPAWTDVDRNGCDTRNDMLARDVAEQRTAFADDPLNLLAVDGPAHMQMSDSDAASWLPKDKACRCDDVARHPAGRRRPRIG